MISLPPQLVCRQVASRLEEAEAGGDGNEQHSTRRLAAKTSHRTKSVMDKLPTEIISHILSYLDVRCQLRLSAVSVRWREAVSDCLRRRRHVELEDTSDAELRALLPRLPSLRALYVSGDQLDLDVVSGNCTRLEKLGLNHFHLDEKCLYRLGDRCPRLWDLCLPAECSPELLEMVLWHLPPSVRSLTLVWTDVSGLALALLPDGLERLEFAGCELYEGERQPADRWPQLTELEFGTTDCDSTRVYGDLVSGCPRLQRLKAVCEADDHLLEMLPAQELLHLDLSMSGGEMTENGLKRLGLMRRLQTLNLYGVSVTDAVLDSLVGAESLRELTLGMETYKPLEHFSLEAVQRLVVLSPSLRLVRLCIFVRDQQQLESLETLISALASLIVSPHPEVTLAIHKVMLGKMPASVLPSPPSALRVISL